METKSDKSERNYADNLELGHIFEDFCSIVLQRYGWVIANTKSRYFQVKKGKENNVGIEYKYQGLMRKYRGLYIETHEKSKKENEDFVESGINRKDNAWAWCTGDFDTIYLIGKRALQVIDKSISEDLRRSNETSLGFALSLDRADRVCLIKLDNLKEEFKEDQPPDEVLRELTKEDKETQTDSLEELEF